MALFSILEGKRSDFKVFYTPGGLTAFCEKTGYSYRNLKYEEGKDQYLAVEMLTPGDGLISERGTGIFYILDYTRSPL